MDQLSIKLKTLNYLKNHTQFQVRKKVNNQGGDRDGAGDYQSSEYQRDDCTCVVF